MRPFVCILMFCLTVAPVVGQSPGTSDDTRISIALAVTCDGKSPKKAKCGGGKLPDATFYEASACQGALPNVGGCKHAIAFNEEMFECADPKSDGKTPPSYTTYCTDSAGEFECTVSRRCTGELKTKEDGVTQYTLCGPVGDPEPRTAYKKIELNSEDNRAGWKCNKVAVIPGTE